MGRTLEIEAPIQLVQLRNDPGGLGLSSVAGHEFELHIVASLWGHGAVSASQESENGKCGGLKFQWLGSCLKL